MNAADVLVDRLLDAIYGREIAETEYVASLVALHEAGMSWRELGAVLGCTGQAVAQYVKRNTKGTDNG